ncbi:hypothetical protein ES332_A07G032900v1, partial [Gossypium tomentosum]
TPLCKSITSKQQTPSFRLMEFKYRAVDERPPKDFPSPSSTFNPLPPQGFLPHPVNLELGKVQLREAIIASDIARRRALEAQSPFSLFPPSLPLSPILLPSPLTQVLDNEVKNTTEKKKLIILEKPDPNRVVGVKRKTPPLEGTGELPLPSISSKGKQQDEWSCAICRVSTTSEKGFTEHLQGKKHKANEARLRANILEKSSNTSTKTITVQKKLGLSNQNEKDELLSKGEKAEERFTEKKYADSFKKEQTDEAEMTPELGKKKKFKFWCDICLVGMHSEVVMETHKKGKKHIAGLLKLDKI